jgi:enoyl-CoA hydratase/carnithine racemase
MLLRRSIIDADQAQSIGLVNGVFADDVFLAGVMDVARDLATLTPACVKLTIELLSYTQGEGFDAGMAMESALASLTLSSPAAKELLGRFLSKGKG